VIIDGFIYFPKWVIYEAGVPEYVRIVALTLSHDCDPQGFCDPDLDGLSRPHRISTKPAEAALLELQRMGRLVGPPWRMTDAINPERGRRKTK